jgi:hypothetical protein
MVASCSRMAWGVLADRVSPIIKLLGAQDPPVGIDDAYTLIGSKGSLLPLAETREPCCHNPSPVCGICSQAVTSARTLFACGAELPACGEPGWQAHGYSSLDACLKFTSAGSRSNGLCDSDTYLETRSLPASQASCCPATASLNYLDTCDCQCVLDCTACLSSVLPSAVFLGDFGSESFASAVGDVASAAASSVSTVSSVVVSRSSLYDPRYTIHSVDLQ